MNQDTVFHTRVVYTIWDGLADVGGLLDSLKYLVKPILLLLNSVSGNLFYRFLTGELFKFEVKNDRKK